MKLLRFAFVLVAFVSFAGWDALAQSDPIISEFMASNTSTLADEDGEYSDWIELFNPSAVPVNLEGWYLTDDSRQLGKWRFPAVTLPPNGFLVVFASGKNRAVAGTQLHTSFNLNADGEYLALVAPDGGTIVSQFSPKFPPQVADVSYGIGTGGNFYFPKPTPGSANSTGILGFVGGPKFSQEHGFFDAPFDLTISTTTPDAVIRYTTNGLAPSATTGLVYASPLPIGATTVLRAAAFKDGYAPSPVETATFIFLNDVIRQSPSGQAPSGWPTSWGGNVVDYGMDPDVVNNAKYSATIKNDLKTVPSYSIVLDLKDLFDSSTGIYANPGQDGRAWERPCSVELIQPDGTKGFQINAGLRIRGGFSRSTGNPKHAFRLFFRSDYGAPKLKYPLFGDKGAEEFDSFDLRTFQNYSWSFQGDSRGIFLRDQFSRDSQLDMGQNAERGYFCHLYINGEYWGLYNTDERPEASYAATYFGGNKEDYDVIKVEAGPYTINATDGNMTAWTKLYTLSKPGLGSDAAYEQIQGNNPDGTPNPDYEKLIDVPNLIDYMLVILYGGNLDAPISNFLGNTSPNNWYGIRNRNGPDGFRFFAHDSEHTLLDVNQNRLGPYSSGDTSVVKSNPQWIWQKMWANAEFKVRLADHIHRHFFNGGALTPQACIARLMARKNEIDRAVVGESARWGDAKRSTPFTRDVEWIAEINRVVNSYMPARSGIVLNQLRTKGLYPSVDAPEFNQHGGPIADGFQLTMTAPSGTIYFTVDGSDPRLRGGNVSAAAKTYGGGIPLTEPVLVKARALNGGVWSALNEATFTPIRAFTDLLITEIMYHPPDLGGVDGDEYEFVELKNVGSVERDLSGIHFTNGIDFTFPVGTKVAPGQFVVVVSNPAEFAKKYPNVRVDGVYTGHLSNSGETLALVHAAGAPIAELNYATRNPWPGAADGQGFSLVPANPNLNPDPNNPVNWRASSILGGSPGADDPSSNIPTVWINEVAAHPIPPQLDAIELHNPTALSVDLSSWYLTDDRAIPKKFQIPPGTQIPAGGYLVFSENQFNSVPGSPSSFALDAQGDQIFLYSADSLGNLTGYSDGFSFGAAEAGTSFGRYTTSTGEIDYPAQVRTTLGTANAGPKIGPVVFNEIQYHPAPGDEEFVELKNISAATVRLYDPNFPTNTWRLDGLGFAFPQNLELPAGGLLVLTAADPATFRQRHSIPANVPVLGPFAGVLQDSGELLQLKKPDGPQTDLAGVVHVPYIVVDEVRYNDKAPWPIAADGTGSSLERAKADAYSNDPQNWHASPGPASPGFENSGNRPPLVNAGLDQTLVAAAFPISTQLAGTASDEGQPNPPGRLTVTWTQRDGPAPAQFADAHQLNTSVTFPGAGTYLLQLTASDGELDSSDLVSVSIQHAAADIVLVPAGFTWKYLDDGVDQGDAWRTAGFNDSAWKSGKAQFGYGDGDEATVVSFGGNSAAKYPTTYYRTAFNIQNAAGVTKLTVKLLRDDGGVVYLNGAEIFRSNMPETDITYATLASTTVGGADESTFYENQVDPSLLVEGRNVLAVEIHQVSTSTSSDTSFDLELDAQTLPTNQPPQVNAGPDLTAAPNVDTQLRGSVIDDGLPLQPGRTTAVWSQISGPGAVVFSSSNATTPLARFPAAGTYALRLSATDGEFSAQDDLVVTVQADSFSAWKSRYFTAAELADATISGDNADPDRDGHSNIQEFLAGTDPRDSASVLKAAVNLSGAGVKFVFQAEAERGYTVQFRDSLNTGGWSKLTDVPAESSARPVEILISPGGNRFYRIVTPAQP